MATRYSAASRYQLDNGGMTASPIPTTPQRYTSYIVRAGDTVEIIAYRIMGDANRWWEIADLNPQVDSILTLTPGRAIRVPA